MKITLIHLIFLLLVWTTLGAEELDEFVIRVPIDPFPVPLYVEPPLETELKTWDYIIRFTEYSHTLTPLVIDVRSKEFQTRYTVFRLVGDRIDLKFQFEIDVDATRSTQPPDWTETLDKSDEHQGVDGKTLGIEIFTKNKRRFLYRWEPETNEKSRGLAEMNAMIRFIKRFAGIQPRPYLPSDKKRNTYQGEG